MPSSRCGQAQKAATTPASRFRCAPTRDSRCADLFRQIRLKASGITIRGLFVFRDSGKASGDGSVPAEPSLRVGHETERLHFFSVKFGDSDFLSTFALRNCKTPLAEIAQLVERNLAKVEVAGPSPVFRSLGQKMRASRNLTKFWKTLYISDMQGFFILPLC